MMTQISYHMFSGNVHSIGICLTLVLALRWKAGKYKKNHKSLEYATRSWPPENEIGPPRPSLNEGNVFWMIPPPLPITTPVLFAWIIKWS